MAPLDIPESGLSLLRVAPPEGFSADFPKQVTQIMRLNLTQSILEELVASLRKDQKAKLRLGKHPSLHFGSRSQPFCTYPESNRSELYIAPPNAKENIYFSGVLSHSLEVQRAKEATAGTDDALVTLEQSLSAFRQGKESKRTPVISAHQMKALRAGDNRTATGREAASLARMSTSKADIEKERFFTNAATRSSPASPAFLASRSPAITPTSVRVPQNKEKIRLDALRVPLIHLLAVRPVSVKFLAQKTRSSQEDCLALVTKYGTENRLNREKYDLKDKIYKDLDVWKFPYPSDDERQEAIDNAISAFDRMRVSKQDKLWQMLLPKHERGQGKVLSRLNIRTGLPPKSVTPRIHVHPSEEPAKESDTTGNESESTTNTPNVNNKKLSATAPKKRPATTTKRAAQKPKNTTITGKVTKKTDKTADKKAAAKLNSKFKSAEYVVDSDEDDEMADSGIGAPSKATNSRRDSPDSQQSDPPAKAKPSAVASSHANKIIRPKPAAKTVQSNPPSRPTTATSPQKPSPLGSSPPTNASDFENAPKSSSTNQSSNSSSPLINHLSRQRAGSTTKLGPPNQSKTAQKTPGSNPLKRKAEEPNPSIRLGVSARPVGLGITHSDTRMPEHKRRRPSTISSGDSTSGNSTPSTSVTILRQRLREKARQFKRYYAKYRALHEDLSNHPSPPDSQLQKLQQQHIRLQQMKKEIWDEDRQLRSK
ncbi:predicted protein [Uncinocarpus reesii 1704]|uniref:Uncharacterized protein n=1 Tax=Uncinocarpus reesii (strain UAMH 1704) TaxID=336963 RepID=C4JDX5_UNCRE|nr:uncharacterized protein UREG_00598 [Uncinocarpus reesii 1704]EEP75751.1 predicted protein [Uncinocarpus reesii 1704]